MCCPSSVANLVNGTLSIVSPFLIIITASDKIVNTCGDWQIFHLVIKFRHEKETDHRRTKS
ncbi:hypothetical protein FOB53_18085 [Providencia stuartii]|nr:hypothetical protein FOB53_18085 [Providencia stuartii]